MPVEDRQQHGQVGQVGGGGGERVVGEDREVRAVADGDPAGLVPYPARPSTAAALCVNTLYTGPLARVLGGVDLALPVGTAVASAVHATLMRRSRDGLGMAQRA